MASHLLTPGLLHAANSSTDNCCQLLIILLCFIDAIRLISVISSHSYCITSASAGNVLYDFDVASYDLLKIEYQKCIMKEI